MHAFIVSGTPWVPMWLDDALVDQIVPSHFGIGDFWVSRIARDFFKFSSFLGSGIGVLWHLYYCLENVFEFSLGFRSFP